MITTRSQLNYYIQEDAKSNGIVLGWKYWVKIIYGNVPAHAFRYLKSLRKWEYYTNNGSWLRFWYRFYNRRLGLRYRLAIPINVVGPGLKLPHLEGGVVLNCKSIGYGCSANADVLCGNKYTQDNRPTIGNNVELCPGCKVIGNVRIGDNVTVAPNAVVISDVPDNAIVGGVPARILKYKERK